MKEENNLKVFFLVRSHLFFAFYKTNKAGSNITIRVRVCTDRQTARQINRKAGSFQIHFPIPRFCFFLKRSRYNRHKIIETCDIPTQLS